jgi:hypothetical protein
MRPLPWKLGRGLQRWWPARISSKGSGTGLFAIPGWLADQVRFVLSFRILLLLLAYNKLTMQVFRRGPFCI